MEGFILPILTILLSLHRQALVELQIQERLIPTKKLELFILLTQVLEKLNSSRHDEPKLQQIFADAGYRGKLIKWVKKKLKMNMTIVNRTDKTLKWAVQPKRWIIERTFAWLLNFRRLVINYERTTESAISYIYLAMMCLMVKNIN